MTTIDPYHFSSVKEFRNAVAAAVVSDLGVFADGIPSIWVDDENAPQVTGGVLAVIEPYFQLRRTVVTYNEGVLEFGDWGLTLRGFGTRQQFRSALEKVRQRFPVRRERILSYREGVRQQVRILVEDVLRRGL